MLYVRCRYFATLLGFVSLAACTSVRAATPPQLTFEQRVAAQRAIERVYYTHQSDATLPFEEAVPPEVIERKVRDYLRQSAALEKQWGVPITVAMLKDEALRMSRSTRMPARLTELYAALSNDPVLVLECLARPALANRLARDHFASDEGLQAVTHEGTTALIKRSVNRKESTDKRSWDDWWIEKAPSFDTTLVKTVATTADILPQPRMAGGCTFDDTWDLGGALAPPAAGDRTAHTAVWTGSRVIVWGGNSQGGALNTGVQYDPVTDTTTPTTTTGAPTPRSRHSAVWTGSHMIVWGGSSNAGFFSTGGSYDPISDTWSAISVTNGPSGRVEHSAVWTGAFMVVWGGYDGGARLDTGGRYDPQTDQWSPVSTDQAPEGRSQHTAVWTGTSMIVWGGSNGSSAVSTGGRYNPVMNAWTPTSALNAPEARNLHTAVWTQSRMIVWGGTGISGALLNTGAIYDETLDAWSTTPIAGAPAARSRHS